MLNGIDPIIIFHFSKLEPDLEKKVLNIPLVAKVYNKIGLPPIPIYLSEQATGLYIDSEDKSIDIETKTDATTDGSGTVTNQKPINSTVKVNLRAKNSALGLILLSAVCDLILPKVTSQEYSITYLHGATTVFGGLLHSFSVSQVPDTDLSSITFEITKAANEPLKDKKNVEVTRTGESANLAQGQGQVMPPPTAPTPIKGPPPNTPKAPPPVKMGGLG